MYRRRYCFKSIILQNCLRFFRVYKFDKMSYTYIVLIVLGMVISKTIGLSNVKLPSCGVQLALNNNLLRLDHLDLFGEKG